MSIWLKPSAGHALYGIAICDRCRMKRYSDELVQDPNYPGLRVCDPGKVREGCRDNYDPWRLPGRPTEKISLPFTRPDVILSDNPLTTTGQEAPYDYTVDKYGSLQPPTQTAYDVVIARALTALIPGNAQLGPGPVRMFIVDSQGNIIDYNPAPGTAQ